LLRIVNDLRSEDTLWQKLSAYEGKVLTGADHVAILKLLYPFAKLGRLGPNPADQPFFVLRDKLPWIPYSHLIAMNGLYTDANHLLRSMRESEHPVEPIDIAKLVGMGTRNSAATTAPAIVNPDLSTIIPAKPTELVPWLAAQGAYSYNPDNPPKDDSLFDYAQIMHNTMPTESDKRYLFGWPVPRSDSPADPTINQYLAFWESARRGEVDPVLVRNGRITPLGFEAPIAVYRISKLSMYGISDPKILWLIQGGNYQIINPQQFRPEDNTILLYRGLTDSTTYRQPTLLRTHPGTERFWAMYDQINFQLFTNSEVAFWELNTNPHKGETNYLRSYVQALSLYYSLNYFPPSGHPSSLAKAWAESDRSKAPFANRSCGVPGFLHGRPAALR